MKHKFSSLLASAGFAAFLLVSAPALAQVLGTASNFAVLGATPQVLNLGPTVVTGSVGINPAAAINGFPPGTIAPGTGTFEAANAVALQAQTDNTTAFGALTGLASVPIPAQLDDASRGGLPLGPGVYRPIAGDFDLTGTLTLAGPGLYVFQTAAALITSSGATSRVLLGGASACDVWWTVPSSATIGTGSVMVGNILALTSIVIQTGASLQGRALAQTGQVSLDTNLVTACSGGTAAGFIVPPLLPVIAPTLSKAFSPSTINAGGVSALTITLTNANAGAATLTAPFTDNLLPSGLTTVGLPTTTCGGVPSATASSVTLPVGTTIPGGAPGSCTLTVNVTAATGGSFLNTLPANALLTSTGNNAAPAVATLTAVVNAIPTLSEWGMIMLAGLLALFGFVAVRRQAR